MSLLEYGASKPHIAITSLAILLALLNIAAGIPKIIQMQQEVDFLSAIGFSGLGVAFLGAIQFTGGCLLSLHKTRLIGVFPCGIALLLSTIAIFAAGNSTFGMLSLVPFVLTLFIGYATWRHDRKLHDSHSVQEDKHDHASN